MIRAEQVTKRYGSHVALDGVDLAIDASETFGLLGPNGAGKSTLVGLIATALVATAGYAVGWHPETTLVFLLALFLEMACFAALGSSSASRQRPPKSTWPTPTS
jgi:ABC-type polysaccharide/polyol phosphate transport system ATPase subunit